MSIEVNSITKTFGTFTALNDVSLHVPDGRAGRPARPLRLGQDDAPADHRRAGAPDAGSGGDPLPGRGRRHGARRATRAGRLRVPALRPVPAHERLRERRLRPARAPAQPTAAKDGDHAPRCTELLKLVQLDWLADRYPVAALRRAAAARGAGPGPGRRAQGAAARRAVRRPRRQGPPGAAAAGSAACTTRST